MFRAHQKVVCVDDSPVLHGGMSKTIKLVKDSIYTVRGINPADLRGPEHLWLAEIKNEISDTGKEYSYRASRFRPIVERKTDISIFEEILRRESVPDECAPAAVYGVDWGASA